MKRHFIVFIILLTSFVAFSETTIQGECKNYKEGSVEIVYKNAQTGADITVKTVVEKGKFTLNLQDEASGFARLFLNKEVTTLWLAPNKNLAFYIDVKEFDESIKYAGDLAVENNFLTAFFLEFEDEGKDPSNSWFGEKDAEDFQKSHADLLKSKLAYFKNYIAKNAISELFARQWKLNQKYKTGFYYLYYPGIRAYYKKLPVEQVVTKAYFDFTKNYQTNNDSFLVLPFYGEYLSQLVSYKTKEILVTSNGGYSAVYPVILTRMMFTGQTRQVIQTGILKSNLDNMDLKLLQPFWDEYIAACDAHTKEIMIEKYNKVLRLQAGNPAPNFTLTSLEGKQVSLSDFKGKVVYLDFWASWCGPCLQEIPSAKELKHTFEGKDVVFLYVSIDENEGNWKKIIKDRELTGVHLLAKGFKHEVPQAYNVSGIPSYFIIDREGNILDNNAPRPSSIGTIIDALNAALEK